MLDSWERYTSKSLRRISEKVTRNHINNRSSSNARVLVLRLRHSGNNREDFKVHLLLTAYLSLTSVDAASTHIALGKGARETIMTQNESLAGPATCRYQLSQIQSKVRL